MNGTNGNFSREPGQVFTHPDGSTLFIHDRGTHLDGSLYWRGPLDDLNKPGALNWLGPLCAQNSWKPLFLNTPSARFVVVSRNGRMHIERILTRRRAR